jgi:D-serine deaminase-like pyridoxal phosphate-dependent protein
LCVTIRNRTSTHVTRWNEFLGDGRIRRSTNTNPLEKKSELTIGDPSFFMPAFTGGIAEHFSEYLVMRNYEIIERWKTYRGEHNSFH